MCFSLIIRWDDHRDFDGLVEKDGFLWDPNCLGRINLYSAKFGSLKFAFPKVFRGLHPQKYDKNDKNACKPQLLWFLGFSPSFWVAESLDLIWHKMINLLLFKPFFLNITTLQWMMTYPFPNGKGNSSSQLPNWMGDVNRSQEGTFLVSLYWKWSENRGKSLCP